LREFKPSAVLSFLAGLFCTLVSFTTLAVDSKWEVVSTSKDSKFEINVAGVTKIQNSLVFDAFTQNESQMYGTLRLLDRYIVSCSGIQVAALSALPWGRGSKTERLRWLDERNISILGDTENLVVNTAFANDYWFLTPNFRKRVQALCSSRPKGLKNIEASIASSKEMDGAVTTYVVLLDTLRTSPKYREIWQAVYKVQVTPITYTDPSSGEVKQVELLGKLQSQKSPNGTALSRSRNRYDCINRKSVNAQFVDYSASGQVLESKSPSEAEISRGWSEIVPGSIGESLIDFVCAL